MKLVVVNPLIIALTFLLSVGSKNATLPYKNVAEISGVLWQFQNSERRFNYHEAVIRTNVAVIMHKSQQ